MLTVARTMIESALVRCETRGVHLRTDYPAQDDRSGIGTGRSADKTDREPTGMGVRRQDFRATRA